MYIELLKNIIIIIVGLIIGYIIGNKIIDNKIYVGPNSIDIINKIFTDENNKKYKLEPKVVTCPVNYQKKINKKP